jgi:hypothetical protein
MVQAADFGKRRPPSGGATIRRAGQAQAVAVPRRVRPGCVNFQRLLRKSRRTNDGIHAPIPVGDVVRVLTVPDPSGMRLRGRGESRVVFAHVRGTYKRVVAFNSLGWPELSFRILNGPYSGLHSVWIEPDLLRVRRTRS